MPETQPEQQNKPIEVNLDEIQKHYEGFATDNARKNTLARLIQEGAEILSFEYSQKDGKLLLDLSIEVADKNKPVTPLKMPMPPQMRR